MQKDPQDRYRSLAAKMLAGTITPEEEAELMAWYNEQEEEPLQVPVTFAGSREEHRARLLQGLQQTMAPVVPMRRKIARLSAAAILVLAVGAALWYFMVTPQAGQQPPVEPVSLAQQDVLPGTDGAVLRLANGKSIVLDTAGNGLLSDGIRKKDNSLVIAADKQSALAPEYNTLTTPRARQQQLVLPDGTRIWLNAASSLRFPTTFSGDTREVEITGEAYFEVAKDAAHPFKVKVGSSTVEVLGTHFNIMAYNNELAVQTTLLEGSVKVSRDQQSLLLKPGQQSSAGSEGLRLVQNADTEMAVAWKNGVQVFRNTALTTILRQVERWYDVSVDYKGAAVEGITFSGEVPRGVSLAELLKVFESNNLHFNINATQRIVTVTP